MHYFTCIILFFTHNSIQRVQMASKLNDDPLFLFLKQGNFEKHFQAFKDLGAKVIQDVLDGVSEEELTKEIGMTPTEAKNFLKMLESYKVSYYHICIFLM